MKSQEIVAHVANAAAKHGLKLYSYDEPVNVDAIQIILKRRLEGRPVLVSLSGLERLQHCDADLRSLLDAKLAAALALAEAA